MLQIMITFFKAFVVDRASLAAENMALRHQLAVLQRSVKRPKPQHRGGLHCCCTRAAQEEDRPLLSRHKDTPLQPTKSLIVDPLPGARLLCLGTNVPCVSAADPAQGFGSGGWSFREGQV